jgi:hypothetical protein
VRGIASVSMPAAATLNASAEYPVIKSNRFGMNQDRILMLGKYPQPIMRVLDSSRRCHKEIPLSEIIQVEAQSAGGADKNSEAARTLLIVFSGDQRPFTVIFAAGTCGRRAVLATNNSRICQSSSMFTIHNTPFSGRISATFVFIPKNNAKTLPVRLLFTLDLLSLLFTFGPAVAERSSFCEHMRYLDPDVIVMNEAASDANDATGGGSDSSAADCVRFSVRITCTHVLSTRFLFFVRLSSHTLFTSRCVHWVCLVLFL